LNQARFIRSIDVYSRFFLLVCGRYGRGCRSSSSSLCLLLDSFVQSMLLLILEQCLLIHLLLFFSYYTHRVINLKYFLTFLCFCHLHSHFLLLSVFDQHVIAAIRLSPNVTRLHIPLSLFFMCHSIVYDLSTLIGCRNTRLFWLWFRLFFLYIFLLFFFCRLEVRFRIFFLHAFIKRHLGFCEC
jgi:hypothetical protein